MCVTKPLLPVLGRIQADPENIGTFERVFSFEYESGPPG